MVWAAWRKPRARSVSFSKSMDIPHFWDHVVCYGRSTTLGFWRLGRVRRKFVPEIVANVPAWRPGSIGKIAGDQIVDPGEFRAGIPVDRLRQIVAWIMIMLVLILFPRRFAAIGIAGRQVNRRSALLDEAIMIGP